MVVHFFPACPLVHLSEGWILHFQQGNGKISAVNGRGEIEKEIEV